MILLEHLTEEVIAQRLTQTAHHPDLSPEDVESFPESFWSETPRPAAVLVPLLRIDGDWHILYTRRTETLAEHKGQVAFPGGRADFGDSSPEMTALREAQEEIGLRPEHVRILGRLDSFRTITNYLVTPVVAVVDWPVELNLAMEEVSRAFTIPLAWLADPANHEIRERTLPAPYAPIPVIYFQMFDDELLWGISARITFNLLKKVVW